MKAAPLVGRKGRSDLGPTAIDLFSGAGGISLGLVNAGFNVLLCSDIDQACAATHDRNFPDIPFVRRDVEKLSAQEIMEKARIRPGELDLLIGGPPCQGFSIIGQRERWDPRNGLFKRFLTIAREVRPRALVIENVSGLATLSKGAVLREIGAACAEAGYEVECAELLAAQYGVPQMRWRMFFIGWRADQGKRSGFPKPTHGSYAIGDLVPNRTISAAETKGFVTIREAIGDLPPIEAGGVGTKYTLQPRLPYQAAMRAGAPDVLANHYAPRLSGQNMERLRLLKPGDDWRSLPHELLPAGMQRALRKDHTRRYRRMQWDGIARSIITRFRDPKSGEYIHPEQDRTISIREAARIQSFPDLFVFEGTRSQQYDQVGNAVPPLLARAVGLEIRAMLEGKVTDASVSVKSRYTIPASVDLAAAE
ncbi:MAG: DNA cytosine methyltransferase [Roseiarcus sp.]